MIPQFSAIELRIIGCLLEKSITTPDYYPLTLNALTNACNQKSNRNPVMALTEDEVFGEFAAMREKGLLESVYSEGNRSERYRQLFTNHFDFSRSQIAIICELFLRTPQTAGELKSRAGRMASFGSATIVAEVLDSLTAFEEGPVVMRLPRGPGQKDNRWTHLFAPAPEPAQQNSSESASHESISPTVLLKSSSDERVVQLENEVTSLKREIKILNQRLDGLGRHIDELARDVKSRQNEPQTGE